MNAFGVSITVVLRSHFVWVPNLLQRASVEIILGNKDHVNNGKS